jgi:hypothetical protein
MITAQLRFIALGFLAVAACGRTNSGSSADTGAAAATVAPAAPADSLPFYETLGHHAENAYDQVRLADWTAARASVDSLSGPLMRAQAQDTAGQGVEIRAAIQSLDSAVRRRDRMQGLRDANTLTKLATLLPAAQTAKTPADVTVLDFYGRELEIWAEAKDMAKLRETSSAIQSTWKELRPRVIALGGNAEAVRFDRAAATVAAARTPAQYGKAATPVLDEVDALEVIFAK